MGKAIIVYGSGNFFCSGLNLNLVKQIIGREWHSTEMALLMSDNFRRLRKLSLLTIALVEKKALGGGAELDMRLMTENAQIGFVHKKMGISTAWCGAISLTNLLGPFKAIEILLSARLIGAEEAYQLGLANYVINSNHIINSNIVSNDSSNVTTTNHLNQSSLNTHSNAITQQQQQQQQQQQIEQQTNQLEPVKLESSLKPINLPAQLNVSNENRTNYCKRIFKRLKKKNDYKEDKLTKRCKLDLDNSEKLRMIDKLMSKRMEVDNSNNKPTVKKCNESSKMFKKMKRILFDVEEKFVIKPEIEMSSCSEDDELLDKIHTQQSQQPDNHHLKTNVVINKTINDSVSISDQSMQIIPDGQPNHKVGLSDKDDNTILNLVYNWLARLTACLEQDSWSELKQLVRDPKSESNDLLRFINHKTSQIKCNFVVDMDKNKKPQQWQVLKSINSVANQTV